MNNMPFNSQKPDRSEYEKNVFIRRVIQVQQRAEGRLPFLIHFVNKHNIDGYIYTKAEPNSHIKESGRISFLDVLSAVPPFSEGLFAVYVQVMWIVPRFGDRL
jgi:hypothetical protein